MLGTGEPVRIIDRARDLVRRPGRDPDSQPFEIVGRRPGEKLHEALFYAQEQAVPTGSTKIPRAGAGDPPAGVHDDVRVWGHDPKIAVYEMVRGRTGNAPLGC